jgi:hypothetical protein
MEEQRRERPALSGHRSKAFLGCVVQKMKVVQQHFCDGGHIFRKPSRGHTAIMHWAKRQPITLAQANMVAKRFDCWDQHCAGCSHSLLSPSPPGEKKRVLTVEGQHACKLIVGGKFRRRADDGVAPTRVI